MGCWGWWRGRYGRRGWSGLIISAGPARSVGPPLPDRLPPPHAPPQKLQRPVEQLLVLLLDQPGAPARRVRQGDHVEFDRLMDDRKRPPHPLLQRHVLREKLLDGELADREHRGRTD